MTQPDHTASRPLRGESVVLAAQECLDLLSTTTVACVAFNTGDGLQLLPLNFAVLDEEIYVRTATDSVLAAMTLGDGEVALGVTYHSPQFREGWSVTVKGRAQQVTDPVTYDTMMTWPRLQPWAGGVRGVVIHIDRTAIQGRRVHGDRPPRDTAPTSARATPPV